MGKMDIKTLMAEMATTKMVTTKEKMNIEMVKAALESGGFYFEITSEVSEKSAKIMFCIGYESETENFAHISQYNMDKHNSNNFFFKDGEPIKEAKSLGFDNAVKKFTTFILTEETKKELYAVRKSMVDAYGEPKAE
jgi:hypothetical protein